MGHLRIKRKGAKMTEAPPPPAQAARDMRAEVTSVGQLNHWDVANMALVIQKLIVNNAQTEARCAELLARLDSLTQPRPVPQPEAPAS